MRYIIVLNGKKKIRIAMAVTNDLVTDRRVQRHMATLREEGYDVVAFGRKDLGVRTPRGWGFYAEYNVRLLWRLLRTRADVIWANDSDTLMGCAVAARMKRCGLVMDAHELFPEVPELVGRDRVKHVWERIERRYMPRCDAMLTVCGSVAEHYRRRYGVEMTVVRNTTVGCHAAGGGTAVGDAPRRAAGARTLLYQGAVNLGRGVDWAIDAIGQLPGCRLVVAGVGDLYDAMRAYAAGKPWNDRIEFLGRVEPAALERLTPTADVGLVMLEDMGLNYHYALPNRIADFVEAGVPMVVSDLPEMAAVVRRFGVGEVIDRRRNNAEGLAEAVRRVLGRRWTADDFAEARLDMDWAHEKQGLLAVADKVTSMKVKQRV